MIWKLYDHIIEYFETIRMSWLMLEISNYENTKYHMNPYTRRN